MTLTFKGIFKSLKKFTKKFVVKREKKRERETEVEIGYPTNVLHVAHVGWGDSSEGGPSWMNDYERAPNFSKTFGSFGESKDPKLEAETSSMPSQASLPSAGEDVKVPKKQKQKKIKSSRKTKASKSKLNNEKEVTPVA